MFQIFHTQSTWRTMARWTCWWARSNMWVGGIICEEALWDPFFIQQNQHSVTKVCIMWVGRASYVKKLFGTLFHSAKPTFSHQSLHHFSNCTKVSLLSLFLEHDLHCFVLSGFSVNHSSTTTTNWVAGILCKVFWVDLEFGDGGWWLWYYAFGSIKSFRWILLKSLPTGPFKGAPVQPYQLYCSEWLPSIELRSIWFGFCIEWYFSLKGAV